MINSLYPIDGRRIRIALIGCGRISRNHIRAIAIHHEHAELIALCDIEQTRLDAAQQLVSEAAQEYPEASKKPEQFIGYDNLLNSIKTDALKVDLVVLTTPSGLHPSQAIAAAEIGVHICTEKPMATCWEDGLAMVRACDLAGVRLFVVKQNRFNSTLQLVKKQIDQGRFGRIALVTVNVFWQRPQSYYDQAAWRGTWKLDGGALMNQASHYVDLLDWLIGPISSISASTATLGRSIEAEDTAALQFRWKSGALGTMSVTMLSFPKNLEGSITILGEFGSVKIGGSAVNQIDLWEFKDSSPDDLEVEKASYQTTSVYGFGHPAYYSNMISTLQGSAESMCDGKQGLKSLEILSAAYESSRSSRVVHLPLDILN